LNFKVSNGVSHILGGPLWGARGGGAWFSISLSVALGPGFLMVFLIFGEAPLGSQGWWGLVFQFFIGRPQPRVSNGVSYIFGGALGEPGVVGFEGTFMTFQQFSRHFNKKKFVPPFASANQAKRFNQAHPSLQPSPPFAFFCFLLKKTTTKKKQVRECVVIACMRIASLRMCGNRMHANRKFGNVW